MYKNMRENTTHSTNYKPYSYYKCVMPLKFPYVTAHWHDELEINYILDGSGIFLCGEKELSAQSGEVVIVPPKTLHSISLNNNKELHYDTLVFNRSMLGTTDNDRAAGEFAVPTFSSFEPIIITKTHPYYNELKPLTENIFLAVKGNTARLDFYLKIELCRLFWMLENGGNIVASRTSNFSKNETMRDILLFISENYSENLTVDMLSQRAHLSKSYFMSLFKSSVGTSVVDYINKLRIKTACEMLLSDNKSVTDIALSCGFKNISNFNRQFKKTVTSTPLEYKRKNT